jgi:hypothetical protein
MIIDSLQKAKSSGTACIYAYFHDSGEQQPRLVSILMSLTRQLLQQQVSDEMSSDIKTVCQSWKYLGKSPTKEEHIGMFLAASAKFNDVFLLIDGLDDCHDSQRERTQQSLLGLLRQLRQKMRILVTTRTSWSRWKKLNADRDIRVTPKREDIETYVKARIAENERLERLLDPVTADHVRSEVISSVADATKGMYVTKLVYKVKRTRC